MYSFSLVSLTLPNIGVKFEPELNRTIKNKNRTQTKL